MNDFLNNFLSIDFGINTGFLKRNWFGSGCARLQG